PGAPAAPRTSPPPGTSPANAADHAPPEAAAHPRRHVGVQLSGVEGAVLSGGDADERHAQVLRRRLPDRRDQPLLLSPADARAADHVAARNAADVPLRAEGAAADHASAAAPR